MRCRLLTAGLMYHFLFLFLLITGAVAQTSHTVKGKVTDDKGNPLGGVSVQVKNSALGTSTNPNGDYTIAVPDQNGTLVFTFVGFITQELAINGQSTLNSQLVPADAALSEVVVVGYGTQQKKDLTGAISVVPVADLKKRTVTTVAEAMQGLVAGVYIRGGGQPGQEA